VKENRQRMVDMEEEFSQLMKEEGYDLNKLIEEVERET